MLQLLKLETQACGGVGDERSALVGEKGRGTAAMGPPSMSGTVLGSEHIAQDRFRGGGEVKSRSIKKK